MKFRRFILAIVASLALIAAAPAPVVYDPLIHIDEDPAAPVSRVCSLLPIRYVVSEKLSPEAKEAFAEAVINWNTFAGTPLFVPYSAAKPKELPVFGVFTEGELEHNKMAPSRNAEVRLNQNTETGCVELGLLVVDDDNNFPKKTAWGKVRTMMHELGHILGLAHIGIRDNLMYPYSFNPPGPAVVNCIQARALDGLYGAQGTKFARSCPPLDAEAGKE